MLQLAALLSPMCDLQDGKNDGQSLNAENLSAGCGFPDPWADDGVETATDSDDDEDGEGDADFFDAAYAEALKAEIRTHAPQQTVNLPPTMDPTAPTLNPGLPSAGEYPGLCIF